MYYSRLPARFVVANITPHIAWCVIIVNGIYTIYDGLFWCLIGGGGGGTSCNVKQMVDCCVCTRNRVEWIVHHHNRMMHVRRCTFDGRCTFDNGEYIIFIIVVVLLLVVVVLLLFVSVVFVTEEIENIRRHFNNNNNKQNKHYTNRPPRMNQWHHCCSYNSTMRTISLMQRRRRLCHGRWIIHDEWCNAPEGGLTI